VLPCFQTVAQVHERLPIANASLSCFQAAGMAARRANDHLRCHHALDGLPYPLVMRVSQSFGVRQPCCRTSRAHDSAHVMLLILLVTA